MGCLHRALHAQNCARCLSSGWWAPCPPNRRTQARTNRTPHPGIQHKPVVGHWSQPDESKQMARPADLCFTHLNYIPCLLTLLESLSLFRTFSVCTNRGFKRAVKRVMGEQLPYGKKKLISLSLVGGDWTIINHIKFRTDTCQEKTGKQSQWSSGRRSQLCSSGSGDFCWPQGAWESVAHCCQKGRPLSKICLWPPPIWKSGKMASLYLTTFTSPFFPLLLILQDLRCNYFKALMRPFGKV